MLSIERLSGVRRRNGGVCGKEWGEWRLVLSVYALMHIIVFRDRRECAHQPRRADINGCMVCRARQSEIEREESGAASNRAGASASARWRNEISKEMWRVVLLGGFIRKKLKQRLTKADCRNTALQVLVGPEHESVRALSARGCKGLYHGPR